MKQIYVWIGGSQRLSWPLVASKSRSLVKGLGNDYEAAKGRPVEVVRFQVLAAPLTRIMRAGHKLRLGGSKEGDNAAISHCPANPTKGDCLSKKRKGASGAVSIIPGWSRRGHVYC